ncbi:MAG: nucleotide exchange factor GrpE [Clostridia bacterium]|nr:nucleotide exchange factor GrpE [Clostridia bacterium]
MKTKNTTTDATEVTTEVEAQSQLSEVEQALVIENEKLIAEIDTLTQENEKLKKTVDRLQSSADKSDTYLNQLVAMKNDFESYKRRMKLNTEQAQMQGVIQVVTKLIDICDTFELASKHLEGDNLKGFEMVHQQFLQILAEFGVKEIEAMGQPFDCMTMNALSKIDRGEENTDKVVEVYKKGYILGEKVIRYAEVIVGA